MGLFSRLKGKDKASEEPAAEKKSAKQVILVSNDIAMRISASVILGAEHVQHYKMQK